MLTRKEQQGEGHDAANQDGARNGWLSADFGDFFRNCGSGADLGAFGVPTRMFAPQCLNSCSTLAVLVVLAMAGCAAGPPVAGRADEQSLDPDAIWQLAERQHTNTVLAVAQRQQLQNDYKTVIRLSRDGDLRGRAYIRLAEINIALAEYDEAKQDLIQSLRASLVPEHRLRALLLLADLLERHIRSHDEAVQAYQQIINEYPALPEAELARLRMGAIDHEQR